MKWAEIKASFFMTGCESAASLWIDVESDHGSLVSVTSTTFYEGTLTNKNDGAFELRQGSQTRTFSHASGDIVVVPEPGAVAMAGLGVILAGRRP